MDWARAIEINRIALTRIVGELIAMLGFVSGRTLERMLRPAESALRRVIVIAAHGLVVKPAISRPMPVGLVIKGKGTGRKSFQLFDTRKSFNFIKVENPLIVMVKTYTHNPYNLFDQMYWSKPKPQTIDKTDRLARRLTALKHALENIPHQAIRLARWTAKREAMTSPKFTSPLRPGRPPGHRIKPKMEVDYILKECHALAWDVSYRNSS
jgi:hypothetical protein